jgi:hypothetical protein
MAQVIVEFGRVGGGGNFTAGNTGAPVLYGAGITGEEVTTSGTSAATTATSSVGDFVSIYNADASKSYGVASAHPHCRSRTGLLHRPR